MYKNNTRQFPSFQSKKKIMTEIDDFTKELEKHDINTSKWYHNLLMGNYYNKDGEVYQNDGIIKSLSNEYVKAFKTQNIETLLLIKTELMNHIPEQVWIHKFFSGDVYDKNGVQLCYMSDEMRSVADTYNKAYSDAKLLT